MQGIEEVRTALREKGDTPITSLASLMRVAIEDGRAMLKRPDVKPTYNTWLAIAREGPIGAFRNVCHACLAGGILLGTLGRKASGAMFESVSPNAELPHVSKALRALEAVRQHNFHAAYDILGVAPEHGSEYDVPDEREAKSAKRSKWWGALLALVSVSDSDISDDARSFRTAGRFEELLDGLEPVADTLEKFEREWM